MLKHLFMAFHNSNSRKAVKYFADTCIGLSCKNIVYSKITAAAASIGVPDAQKTVFSAGGNLLFFSSIEDIIETVDPQNVYLLVPRRYSQIPVPYDQIITNLKAKKVLVAVGGSSPGLTRKELDLGESIYIKEIGSDINPIALTALFLNGLIQKIRLLDKQEMEESRSD
ncbi:MAG: RecB-family nuclease [Candidatus Heimdallarchaeota archaeon]